MITPTPAGATASHMALAISLVNLSWTENEREDIKQLEIYDIGVVENVLKNTSSGNEEQLDFAN